MGQKKKFFFPPPPHPTARSADSCANNKRWKPRSDFADNSAGFFLLCLNYLRFPATPIQINLLFQFSGCTAHMGADFFPEGGKNASKIVVPPKWAIGVVILFPLLWVGLRGGWGRGNKQCFYTRKTQMLANKREGNTYIWVQN